MCSVARDWARCRAFFPLFFLATQARTVWSWAGRCAGFQQDICLQGLLCVFFSANVLMLCRQLFAPLIAAAAFALGPLVWLSLPNGLRSPSNPERGVWALPLMALVPLLCCAGA